MQTAGKMDVESLQHINNEMTQISCNNKYVQIKQSRDISEKCASINCNHENILFPLFRLPIDIIKNTSLFLNENDIFSFEKCCRLFYQMINNLSYLKKTKNFKTFELDNKRFDQIIESKYSFYKYSQTNIMEMTLDVLGSVDEETNQNVTEFVSEIHSKWEKAKSIDKYDGYWLTNLFKSIKSLTLLADLAMALLNKLPLKILFDSQSQLERFVISHYWNGTGKFGHLQQAIDDFEKEYLQLKENFQQQGKKVKKLQCLECVTPADLRITGPRYIETQHLIMSTIHPDCPLQGFLPTIDVLTCNNAFYMPQLDKIDCCTIDTLRLIDFREYSCSSTVICINDKVIETLNLHRNLVNLTIEINLNASRWMKVIETILCKQYYHNLYNVNILIKMFDNKSNSVFQMLKKNVSILKHQFKQLNIGLRIVCDGCIKYCTIEWNSQIDEKYLDRKEQEMNGDAIKYKQWLDQWTNGGW